MELPFERPNTSAADPSPATAVGSGSRVLTLRDGMAYVMTVKDTLKDKPENYEEFIKVLKDFRFHRIDSNGVVKKVKELFEGHWDLIPGFNTFLPDELKIKCPEETMDERATTVSSGSKVTRSDAVAYVKKVKDTLKDKRENYDEFLKVLSDYKNDRIDTSGVIKRVKELFEGHRDLILGFNAYLPDELEIKYPEEMMDEGGV